jgi:hypothetical protein
MDLLVFRLGCIVRSHSLGASAADTDDTENNDGNP